MADDVESRRTGAFQRDLSDFRALLPKLERTSTDNLTPTEVRLVGRMVAWRWLREMMNDA